LGWIACRDRDIMAKITSHRDYCHISSGMLDEAIAALALSRVDLILERSRLIVRDNLAILKDFVDSTPQLSWVMPQAGTTALLHYKLMPPLSKSLFA